MGGVIPAVRCDPIAGAHAQRGERAGQRVRPRGDLLEGRWSEAVAVEGGDRLAPCRRWPWRRIICVDSGIGIIVDFMSPATIAAFEQVRHVFAETGGNSRPDASARYNT